MYHLVLNVNIKTNFLCFFLLSLITCNNKHLTLILYDHFTLIHDIHINNMITDLYTNWIGGCLATTAFVFFRM